MNFLYFTSYRPAGITPKCIASWFILAGIWLNKKNQRIFLFALACLVFIPSLYAQGLNEQALELYASGDQFCQHQEFTWGKDNFQQILALDATFPTTFTLEVHKKLAWCSFFAKDYKLAINELELLLQNPSLKETESSSLRFMLALSYFDLYQGYPFPLRQASIDQGFAEGQKMAASAKMDFSAAFSAWKQAQKDVERQFKSPTLAGFLGIVPGLGSFYADRPWEGVFSFFVVSLFSLSTIEAHQTKQLWLEIPFGFLSLAFYGGSIYAGIASTHNYNSDLELKAFNHIRDEYSLYLNF